MKRLVSCLAAIALLTPVVLSAAAFEGKVTMKTTGPRGRSAPMTFSLKPGHSRIDVETGQGRSVGMIFDPGQQQIVVLMPEQRMYVVRPMPKIRESSEGAEAPETGGVEKTSEHEKILGYDTTKYVAASKQGTSEIWITDQLGTFMGLGREGGPIGGGFGGRMHGRRSSAGQAWESAFKGRDAFPLRVVTKNAKGREVFRMEATSIEKTPLPDSVFEPPADYRKLDMENMMRGMGMPSGPRSQGGN